MQHETVIVLDFGGQYNQLIARRVRENNVYCEIYSYKTDLSVIKAKNPKGIIFTGGPNSVYLCLLYTSDAADEEDSVDIGGRRITKKKENKKSLSEDIE